MNIKEFERRLIEKLRIELPKEMGWEIQSYMGKHVNQNNTQLINIKDSERKLNRIVALESLFERYNDGMDLENIVESIATTVSCNFNDAIDLLYNFDYIKDKILAKVVNLPKNRKVLKTLPHKEIEDLAVMYYIVLSSQNNCDSTVTVDYHMMGYWDLSDEELYDLAMVNTAIQHHPTASSIESLLAEEFDDLPPSPIEMLVVTGDGDYANGAVYITCKKVLKQLADKLNDDIYMLPSSKQEFIVCRKSDVDPDSINNMIVDANENVLESGFFLSNHAYEYIRETNQINSVY